jgi:mRNA-degrading endonuclease RelE of RelBE toxin-antitoxin system
LKIARTEKFKSAWARLTEEDKIRVKKAVIRLVTDMRYPSLRVKKVRSMRDIWEARVSHSTRLTFQISDDTIILRNIGPHDETLERP